MGAPADSILVEEEKMALDNVKFGKLLQLKSAEQITTEDFKEIVSKQIFQHEYKEKLRSLMKPTGAGRGRDTQNDEIFEELLFLTYYLNEKVIPQNNDRKEKIRENLKKDETNLVAIGRLQEYCIILLIY